MTFSFPGAGESSKGPDPYGAVSIGREIDVPPQLLFSAGSHLVTEEGADRPFLVL